MSTQTSHTWSHMSAAGLVAVVLKRDSLMAVGPLVGFSVSAGEMKHVFYRKMAFLGRTELMGWYGYVAKPLEAIQSLQASKLEANYPERNPLFTVSQ